MKLDRFFTYLYLTKRMSEPKKQKRTANKKNTHTKTQEEELKAQHVADTLKSNEEISKLEAEIRSLKVQPP